QVFESKFASLADDYTQAFVEIVSSFEDPLKRKDFIDSLQQHPSPVLKSLLFSKDVDGNFLLDRSLADLSPAEASSMKAEIITEALFDHKGEWFSKGAVRVSSVDYLKAKLESGELSVDDLKIIYKKTHYYDHFTGGTYQDRIQRFFTRSSSTNRELRNLLLEQGVPLEGEDGIKAIEQENKDARKTEDKKYTDKKLTIIKSLKNLDKLKSAVSWTVKKAINNLGIITGIGILYFASTTIAGGVASLIVGYPLLSMFTSGLAAVGIIDYYKSRSIRQELAKLGTKITVGTGSLIYGLMNLRQQFATKKVILDEDIYGIPEQYLDETIKFSESSIESSIYSTAPFILMVGGLVYSLWNVHKFNQARKIVPSIDKEVASLSRQDLVDKLSPVLGKRTMRRLLNVRPEQRAFVLFNAGLIIDDIKPHLKISSIDNIIATLPKDIPPRARKATATIVQTYERDLLDTKLMKEIEFKRALTLEVQDTVLVNNAWDKIKVLPASSSFVNQLYELLKTKKYGIKYPLTTAISIAAGWTTDSFGLISLSAELTKAINNIEFGGQPVIEPLKATELTPELIAEIESNQALLESLVDQPTESYPDEIKDLLSRNNFKDANDALKTLNFVKTSNKFAVISNSAKQAVKDSTFKVPEASQEQFAQVFEGAFNKRLSIPNSARQKQLISLVGAEDWTYLVKSLEEDDAKRAIAALEALTQLFTDEKIPRPAKAAYALVEKVIESAGLIKTETPDETKPKVKDPSQPPPLPKRPGPGKTVASIITGALVWVGVSSVASASGLVSGGVLAGLGFSLSPVMATIGGVGAVGLGIFSAVGLWNEAKVRRLYRAQQQLREELRTSPYTIEGTPHSDTSDEYAEQLTSVIETEALTIQRQEIFTPKQEMFSGEFNPASEQATIGQSIEAIKQLGGRKHLATRKTMDTFFGNMNHFLKAFNHGTGSAALVGIVRNNGRLVPTGTQIEEGFVSFSGEMAMGLFGMWGEEGVSMRHVSGVSSQSGSEVPLKYTRRVTEEIKWNPNIGNKRVASYETALQNPDLSSEQRKEFELSLKIEQLRLKQWEELDEFERKIVIEQFPIVIATNSFGKLNKFTDIKGEVIVNRPIDLVEENAVFYTDAANVEELKQYLKEKLGEDFPVYSFEPYEFGSAFTKILGSRVNRVYSEQYRIMLRVQQRLRDELRQDYLDYLNAKTPDAFIPEDPIGFLKTNLQERFPDYKFRGYSLNELYEADAGVSERISIEEHTQTVFDQFNSQQSLVRDNLELKDPIDSQTFMRVLIAVHDLGKPIAIAEGDKNLQYQYNAEIAREIMTMLGFKESQIILAVELLKDDTMGKLMKQEITSTQAYETILDSSKKAGVSAETFFNLLTALYTSDASAYPYLKERLFEEKYGRFVPQPQFGQYYELSQKFIDEAQLIQNFKDKKFTKEDEKSVSVFDAIKINILKKQIEITHNSELWSRIAHLVEDGSYGELDKPSAEQEALLKSRIIEEFDENTWNNIKEEEALVATISAVVNELDDYTDATPFTNINSIKDTINTIHSAVYPVISIAETTEIISDAELGLETTTEEGAIIIEETEPINIETLIGHNIQHIAARTGDLRLQEESALLLLQGLEGKLAVPTAAETATLRTRIIDELGIEVWNTVEGIPSAVSAMHALTNRFDDYNNEYPSSQLISVADASNAVRSIILGEGGLILPGDVPEKGASLVGERVLDEVMQRKIKLALAEDVKQRVNADVMAVSEEVLKKDLMNRFMPLIISHPAVDVDKSNIEVTKVTDFKGKPMFNIDFYLRDENGNSVAIPRHSGGAEFGTDAPFIRFTISVEELENGDVNYITQLDVNEIKGKFAGLGFSSVMLDAARYYFSDMGISKMVIDTAFDGPVVWSRPRFKTEFENPTLIRSEFKKWLKSITGKSWLETDGQEWAQENMKWASIFKSPNYDKINDIPSNYPDEFLMATKPVYTIDYNQNKLDEETATKNIDQIVFEKLVLMVDRGIITLVELNEAEEASKELDVIESASTEIDVVEGLAETEEIDVIEEVEVDVAITPEQQLGKILPTEIMGEFKARNLGLPSLTIELNGDRHLEAQRILAERFADLPDYETVALVMQKTDPETGREDKRILIDTVGYFKERHDNFNPTAKNIWDQKIFAYDYETIVDFSVFPEDSYLHIHKYSLGRQDIKSFTDKGLQEQGYAALAEWIGTNYNEYIISSSDVSPKLEIAMKRYFKSQEITTQLEKDWMHDRLPNIPNHLFDGMVFGGSVDLDYIRTAEVQRVSVENAEINLATSKDALQADITEKLMPLMTLHPAIDADTSIVSVTKGRKNGKTHFALAFHLMDANGEAIAKNEEQPFVGIDLYVNTDGTVVMDPTIFPIRDEYNQIGISSSLIMAIRYYFPLLNIDHIEAQSTQLGPMLWAKSQFPTEFKSPDRILEQLIEWIKTDEALEWLKTEEGKAWQDQFMGMFGKEVNEIRVRDVTANYPTPFLYDAKPIYVVDFNKEGIALEKAEAEQAVLDIIKANAEEMYNRGIIKGEKTPEELAELQAISALAEAAKIAEEAKAKVEGVGLTESDTQIGEEIIDPLAPELGQSTVISRIASRSPRIRSLLVIPIAAMLFSVGGLVASSSLGFIDNTAQAAELAQQEEPSVYTTAEVNQQYDGLKSAIIQTDEETTAGLLELKQAFIDNQGALIKKRAIPAIDKGLKQKAAGLKAMLKLLEESRAAMLKGDRATAYSKLQAVKKAVLKSYKKSQEKNGAEPILKKKTQEAIKKVRGIARDGNKRVTPKLKSMFKKFFPEKASLEQTDIDTKTADASTPKPSIVGRISGAVVGIAGLGVAAKIIFGGAGIAKAATLTGAVAKAVPAVTTAAKVAGATGAATKVATTATAIAGTVKTAGATLGTTIATTLGTGLGLALGIGVGIFTLGVGGYFLGKKLGWWAQPKEDLYDMINSGPLDDAFYGGETVGKLSPALLLDNEWDSSEKELFSDALSETTNTVISSISRDKQREYTDYAGPESDAVDFLSAALFVELNKALKELFGLGADKAGVLRGVNFEIDENRVTLFGVPIVSVKYIEEEDNFEISNLLDETSIEVIRNKIVDATKQNQYFIDLAAEAKDIEPTLSDQGIQTEQPIQQTKLDFDALGIREKYSVRTGKPLIGIIGAASPSAGYSKAVAEEIGRKIQQTGAIMFTGGVPGAGVDTARGFLEQANAEEFFTILPEGTRQAHGYDGLTDEPVTVEGKGKGMLERRTVIAKAADVIVVVNGGYGTLDEAVQSLQEGRQVIATDTGGVASLLYESKQRGKLSDQLISRGVPLDALEQIIVADETNIDEKITEALFVELDDADGEVAIAESIEDLPNLESRMGEFELDLTNTEQVAALKTSLNHPYKAVVFDVDGTLKDSGSSIPGSILNRIKALLENGIHVAIATGRGDSVEKVVVERIAERLSNKEALKNLHVYKENGARGYNAGTRETYYELLFSDETTAGLENIMEDTPGLQMIRSRDTVITVSAESAIALDALYITLRDKIEDLNKQLDQELIVKQSGGFVDIMPVTTSKSYSINDMMERLGISNEDIAKVGDQGRKGGNDYEMLQEPNAFSVGFGTDTIAPHVTTEKGAKATRWLLDNIYFDTQDDFSPSRLSILRKRVIKTIVNSFLGSLMLASVMLPFASTVKGAVDEFREEARQEQIDQEQAKEAEERAADSEFDIPKDRRFTEDDKKQLYNLGVSLDKAKKYPQEFRVHQIIRMFNEGVTPKEAKELLSRTYKKPDLGRAFNLKIPIKDILAYPERFSIEDISHLKNRVTPEVAATYPRGTSGFEVVQLSTAGITGEVTSQYPSMNYLELMVLVDSRISPDEFKEALKQYSEHLKTEDVARLYLAKMSYEESQQYNAGTREYGKDIASLKMAGITPEVANAYPSWLYANDILELANARISPEVAEKYLEVNTNQYINGKVIRLLIEQGASAEEFAQSRFVGVPRAVIELDKVGITLAQVKDYDERFNYYDLIQLIKGGVSVDVANSYP
ncbi:HAD-IIB family hydrolase, partial [Candidatus Woesearchaeota archaeon]|nr:HAD-IIB family hydrolase [Candidatus Woesearchaeota archaeon]